MAMETADVVIGLYAGEKTAPERAYRKWQDTLDQLNDRGAEAVLINHGTEVTEEGAFAEATALYPAGQTALLTETIPGVLRDYTGRFAGHSRLRAINERTVLDMVQDKGAMYEFFGSSVMGRTAQLNLLTGREAEDYLHDMTGTQVVIKPAMGLGAQDVHVVTKEVAAGMLPEILQNGRAFLLQEFMPGTMPADVIAGIKGIDEEQQVRIKPEAEHEVRLFVTGDTPDQVVPVLRQLERTEDGSESYYVYIDPESVPAEVFTLGHKVFQAIRQKTGVPEIMLAIDCIYHADGDSEEGWRLREANGKEPGTPKSEHNAAIARLIHANYAEQMIRTAKMGMKA